MSDLETRVMQRNQATNDYLILDLGKIEILHASPVRRVNGEVRKQPEVEMNCDGSHLYIYNRSVLFRFLKTIDPDLKYVDFNRFLDHFDLKSMIEDFIESAPGMSMPVWTVGQEINAIDDGAWQTNSQYLLTIHDEMFEYYPKNKVYLRTVDMGPNKRPAICIEDGDRVVEIVCDQQRTHLTLRIKVGDGFVQPMETMTIHGWIHLIPSDDLYEDIDKLIDTQVHTVAHAKARINGTEVESPSRGRANNIPFYPRNKIEREDYFLLSQ
jgi:hypothetical protein